MTKLNINHFKLFVFFFFPVVLCCGLTFVKSLQSRRSLPGIFLDFVRFEWISCVDDWFFDLFFSVFRFVTNIVVVVSQQAIKVNAANGDSIFIFCFYLVNMTILNMFFTTLTTLTYAKIVDFLICFFESIDINRRILHKRSSLTIVYKIWVIIVHL